MLYEVETGVTEEDREAKYNIKRRRYRRVGGVRDEEIEKRLIKDFILEYATIRIVLFYLSYSNFDSVSSNIE